MRRLSSVLLVRCLFDTRYTESTYVTYTYTYIYLQSTYDACLLMSRGSPFGPSTSLILAVTSWGYRLLADLFSQNPCVWTSTETDFMAY